MLEGSIRSRVNQLRRILGDLRVRSLAVGTSTALKLSPKVSRILALVTRRRLVTIQIKGFNGNLHFRPGSSDSDVVGHLFLTDYYSWLARLDRVSTVIDCGANIGATAFLFLNVFPDARLVAIEPDGDNYDVLRRNLEQFGDRAVAVNAAVWSHDTMLRLVRGEFLDGREWTYQAKEHWDTTLEAVPAKSLPTVMRELGLDSIDLLKIDIEGGELDLFSREAHAWLPRVRNISIELHGQQCSDAFFAAMGRYDFELIRQGELTVCLGVTSHDRDAGCRAP